MRKREWFSLSFLCIHNILLSDPGDVYCRFGEGRGHAVQVASRSKDGSGRVDSFVDTIGTLAPDIFSTFAFSPRSALSFTSVSLFTCSDLSL